MNTELAKLLDVINGLKVLVIGEAMLDSYLTGFSDRLCPEAPVPVVTVTKQKYAPGGAANTAVNIQTLGGDVKFLSVIGDDWEGVRLRQALEANNVSTEYLLTQPGRQTLTKQRVVAASQLLLRFDQGSTEAINLAVEQALIEQLANCVSDCEALIVSDYGYGILTAKVIDAIAIEQSSPRILVVDSKNLAAYRHLNVTAVKPNYNQAIELLRLEVSANSLVHQHTRADQIAMHKEKLLDLTGAKIAAVTLDAEGAVVFERNCPSYRTYAPKASQFHATGAGDTFVSALTLALAAKATTPLAAELASKAAAIVVSKDGTTACSTQELREFVLHPSGIETFPATDLHEPRVKVDTSVQGSTFKPQNSHTPQTALRTFKEKYIPNPRDLIDCLPSYRAAGCQIVFTNGCFDILHSGHVSYLNRAKALGDILIIGVNSDSSVSRLKGPSRPINPLLDRSQVLAALSCVDYLIPFDEDTPSNLIQLIRPDIYVKGGDYTKQTLPEAPLVEQLGGVVEILSFVADRSTTGIIKRICQQP